MSVALLGGCDDGEVRPPVVDGGIESTRELKGSDGERSDSARNQTEAMSSRAAPSADTDESVDSVGRIDITISVGDDAGPSPLEETGLTDSGSDMGTTATSGALPSPSAETQSTASESSTGPSEGTATPTDPRLGCGEMLDPTQTVSGDLTGNLTWSGVVHVTGNALLQNQAQLTIAPGTRIIVDPDVLIQLGNTSAAPTVVANGTSDAPIVFCGSEANPGHWRGLSVGTRVTTNSELHYVRIFDGGSTTPALDIGAAILIDNLEVHDSASVGVRAATFGSGSSGLSVFSSAAAVTLTTPSAVTNFPRNGEFLGNAENLARLTFSRVEEPTIYGNLGIPYLQVSNTEVMSQATVAFEAGVDYRLSADVSLSLGAFANVATWTVEGTADEPVIFQGSLGTPGHWGGIVVGPNVASTSVVEHLEVRHGGGGDRYALDVQAPITVTHLVLRENARGGRVGETGLSDDSSNWTATENETEPLTVHPNALTRIPAGDYGGNGSDRIVVTAGTNTSVGVVRDQGVPYYVESSWDTRAGSNLTLEANTEFLMGPDTRVTFGAFAQAASVVFAGTQAAPIRFSAGQPDFVGYWSGLLIGTAVQTGSSMTWTLISDAGGPANDAAALRIDKAAFPVTNTSFLNFDNYGILVNNDDNMTDYQDPSLGNTFEGAPGHLANVGN